MHEGCVNHACRAVSPLTHPLHSHQEHHAVRPQTYHPIYLALRRLGNVPRLIYLRYLITQACSGAADTFARQKSNGQRVCKQSFHVTRHRLNDEWREIRGKKTITYLDETELASPIKIALPLIESNR